MRLNLPFTGLAASVLLILSFAGPAAAQEKGPVAKWSFNESDGTITRESVSGVDDPIHGIFKHVKGVSGLGLRFDGDSTAVIQAGGTLPRLTYAISVEAWIAINTYPWNWVPILDNSQGEEAGYFFGIDSSGHLGLQLAVNGKWESLTSSAPVPLKKWTHVAATFDSDHGLAVYLDGKLAGELSAQGSITPVEGQDLIIGRVREPLVPTHWLHPKYPVWYSFDGIIDELQVYDRPLAAAEIAQDFSAIQPPAQDVLPYPVLPSGPPGPGPFGAYYATLKYDEMWDAERRVGPDSDVVVRFDQSPIRLVFWQGTNYIPAWVSENGKWYTDEFMETWGPGCPSGGDCEPMSDKQNRYAHARIIESTPARAVVEFRYGLCEVENYVCAYPDPYTGWTDWGDEYYTVYPDGVAARKEVAWTSNFGIEHGKPGHEFQETIIINAPGTRPEDNINSDALTLGNMKGETYTYSWAKESPAKLDQPPGANIQEVNIKSTWKPFQIVSPVNDSIRPYHHKDSTYSIFEWWNHWPVAQVKSSGILAVAPDKPSHSSLSHIEGQIYAVTSDSITKIMLDGLTTKPAAELVPLAKSWLSPPKMTLAGEGFGDDGYDPAQRAFVIERAKEETAEKLRISFAATEGSPLVNPAIVINNWNHPAPRMKVNGKEVSWGPDFRCGLVNTLEGNNLVIWLKLQTTEPETVELIPGKLK